VFFVKKKGDKNMGGKIVPGNFGPSFVFELDRNIINKELFKELYRETIFEYKHRRDGKDLRKLKAAYEEFFPHAPPFEEELDYSWELFRSYGSNSTILNTEIFNHFYDLHLTLTIFPYEQLKAFNKKMLYSLQNEKRYEYAIIRTFKSGGAKTPLLHIDPNYGDSQNNLDNYDLSYFYQRYREVVGNDEEYNKIVAKREERRRNREERMAKEQKILIHRRHAFHEILKVWIQKLNPNFVWGDYLTVLKKYEKKDSRLKVWGYNYYPPRFVEAIGRDRFFDMVKKTWEWRLEEVAGGILLIGQPDPYQMKQTPKNDAAKFLRIKECLGEIVEIGDPVKFEFEGE
jgi:hypothetical protein